MQQGPASILSEIQAASLHKRRRVGFFFRGNSMSNDGPSAYGLEEQGFRNLKSVLWNLTPPRLYEIAVARGEGQVAKNGPLVVLTGQHTGRSASDKFVVRDAASESQV